MKRNVDELSKQRFDVLIIGGGITGAWTALDCAQRGLSVALIERADFGSKTSAASSKLLHGGIRYLQQFQFAKVRESAMERASYLRVAPQLSHALPFLVPTYSNFKQGRFFLGGGMALYQMLCAGQNRRIGHPDRRIPPPAFMGRKRLLQQVPLQNPDLNGAYVLPEFHMLNSERMTLTILQTAAAAGARPVNYVQAEEFLYQDGEVNGVRARDLVDQRQLKIQARLTINAAGPWTNALNRRLDSLAGYRLTTGFSVGSHLVTRQLISDYAVAIPSSFQGDNRLDRGGRHIFILPWRGHSLIGTSYVPAGADIDHLKINETEIEQLMGTVQSALPSLGLRRSDIRHSFSGLYPLQTTRIDANAYQGTGDYQIIDHQQQDGLAGMITALGAKFTTARLAAEKASDMAVSQLQHDGTACRTHTTPLLDSDIDSVEDYTDDRIREYAGLFDRDTVHRLVRKYGRGIDTLAERCRLHPEMNQRIGDSRATLVAELAHAIENEMTLGLDDFLYRRSGIGTIGYPGDAIAERCANYMAEALDHDPAWAAQALERLDRDYRFTP